MDLTEQQVNHIAGLRAMADYLEEHPALIPNHRPMVFLHPYTADATAAYLREMGEPLVESSSSSTIDRKHELFTVNLSVPASARVNVSKSPFVPEVARAVASAATATARRIAVEEQNAAAAKSELPVAS